MPYKYYQSKGYPIPKQRYKLSNWSEYNRALKQRGDIEVWLNQEVIKNWYEQDRVYDGAGAPKFYSDLAIVICHEIRQVYHLPLRQTEGFIHSLFCKMKLEINCPDYTTLSKRLSQLNISCPRYRKTDRAETDTVAIAIDSTGLKRFGRDEWHQEKHKVSAKRSWRKLHIAVDNKHYIQACLLTDRFTSDDTAANDLIEQIELDVDHITADGAYDKNTIYKIFSNKFKNADIVIPPSKNAKTSKRNHKLRNRDINEIKKHGQPYWQRSHDYGKRNYSELCIQRYKRILGRQLHARNMGHQTNEAMIGCGILNRMTSLGMPKSYRVA